MKSPKKISIPLKFLALCLSFSLMPMGIGRAENPRDVEIRKYVEQLQDKRVDVRIDAANALKEIALDSNNIKILPALIKALKDPNPEVRTNIVRSIKDIAPDAQQAVPALVEALKDKNKQVAQYAAEALAEIGPGAKSAVPALIEALNDKNDLVRHKASKALEKIGLPASQQLLAALKDPDQNWRVHHGAIVALSGMRSLEKQLLPDLIDLFEDEAQNWRVRQRIAMYSLHNMGPRAKEAVPVLLQGLTDEKMQVRQGAAHALGGIGVDAKEAIPELLRILQDSQEALVVRAQSAYALGGIGLIEKDDRIVPALVKSLQEQDVGIRYRTAEALGKIGRKNIAQLFRNDVLQKLVERLEDTYPQVQEDAIGAIAQLSTELQLQASQLTEAQLDKAVAQLEKAQTALQQKSNTIEIEEEKLVAVQQALTRLQQEESSRISQKVLKWVQQHPWSIPIALLPIAYLALLWLRPGWLLLLPSELTIPKTGIKLSAPVLLYLKSRPRILDAWVASHLDLAQQNFAKYSTVQDRNIHIPTPVIFDGNTLTDLIGKDVRSTFAKKQGRLLIWGEGGSGKTSLACQLAKWAMASDPSDRLCSHLMLSVLVEQELNFEVAEGRHPFREAIKLQLQALIGEMVPDELLEQLLRQRRILVIVDHFSEMSERTCQAIEQSYSNFQTNALVVTSRLKKILPNLPMTVIEPLRIEGDRLSSFMEHYLTRRGERSRFSDTEYFDACMQLSQMVGQRRITVLLAKLYADQMIARKERNQAVEEGSFSSLPHTIPDLMLNYLNEVNGEELEEEVSDRTVRQDCRAIAWECLKHTYRPAAAKRNVVLQAMRGNDDTDKQKRLEHLEKRLKVIQTIDSDQERIRFTLDPLAEYLAGLHLIEQLGDDATQWQQFLSDADTKPGTTAAIQGFLRAVYDCCLARKTETEVSTPSFVLEALEQRTNLICSIPNATWSYHRNKPLLAGAVLNAA